MITCRTIILLIASAFVVAAAQAEDGHADPARIVGTYHGQAVSGGVVVEVLTTFHLDKSDTLLGAYKFKQGDEWHDGTLTKARLSQRGDVTFIWQDVYGAGTLTITFADDYQTFTGAWSGLEDTSEAFPWTGKRTK